MRKISNSMRLLCPHCESRVRIRSSFAQSEITREGYVECTDIVHCGWRGKFALSYNETLVQSATPSPSINLPVKVNSHV